MQRPWMCRIGVSLAIGFLGAGPTPARALTPLPLPDVPVGLADAALPGVVNAIAVPPDGGMIVGGHFSAAGTALRDNILRLDPDGRLDPAWRPSIGLRSVDALAIGPQGEV